MSKTFGVSSRKGQLVQREGIYETSWYRYPNRGDHCFGSPHIKKKKFNIKLQLAVEDVQRH